MNYLPILYPFLKLWVEKQQTIYFVKICLCNVIYYYEQDQSLDENDRVITEFEEHADKMCQVASFAAASSTDATRKFYL